MPAPLTCSQNPQSKEDDKPSNSEDLVALVHSLTQRADSLTSTWAKDLAELQYYQSQPPPLSTLYQGHSSAYDRFLQAPHCLADNGPTTPIARTEPSLATFPPLSTRMWTPFLVMQQPSSTQSNSLSPPVTASKSWGLFRILQTPWWVSSLIPPNPIPRLSTSSAGTLLNLCTLRLKMTNWKASSFNPLRWHPLSFPASI
ncbi:hypothetical protein O181_038674 [Austropuccinia psidii MF-1]|uniref:Uncharacterized protein n=1 Tax=Austropuccinia psidii MF-1 TaxID=1389203 RepID=A0A9Q3D8W5_9BASI|nr:hypothetical protein [Austropuccinia psidii MF-1]